MTRIVAGAAGGRRLRVPAGRHVRPTGERAREALFSSLGDLTGLRFLDLFAGTGAVGLEALSRGAATATLVEAEPAVLRIVQANVAELGLPGAEVVAARVERYLADQQDRLRDAGGYDVVFLDPPYALEIDPVLHVVLPWVGDRIVVERATRDGAPTWPDGLTGSKERRYGDTTLWYGRRS